MGVWEKLSPEKKAEYRHRMEKVRKNPNARIPSEYHRNMMAEPEKTIPTRPKKKSFFQKLKTTKNRD